MLRLLAVICTLCVITLPVSAQEKSAGSAPPPAKAATKTPLDTWMDAENALIETLSNKDKESVFILRNKHSVIRVIRVVERDIKAAAQSCGKNNPEMKERMDARFKQWQSAVNPILDMAQKQLDKDIKAQKMVDAKEFRRVLKLNDAAYEYGENQIVKRPVTTPEACEGLIESMNRTENEMILLLRETLLPESVIRARDEKAAKEEKQQEKPQEKPQEKKAE
jgi:hypothetical protein